LFRFDAVWFSASFLLLGWISRQMSVHQRSRMVIFVFYPIAKRYRPFPHVLPSRYPYNDTYDEPPIIVSFRFLWDSREKQSADWA